MLWLLPLTQDKFTCVDNVDASWAKQHKWTWQAPRAKTGKGYAVRWEKGKKIFLHKEVLNFPPGIVDHADGNSLNNSRINLRLATPSQNSANTVPYGKSKYRGVHPQKNGLFRARITLLGKTKHLGKFKSEVEAALAYDKAALKLFCEFAKLNFPEKIEGYL